MLATQDVCVSNDLLRARLIQCRRVIDLQELAFAREAAEFAASDVWDEDGSVSAIDWLRFNCHMTAGTAANAVAVGEILAQLPESLQAVVDGEIGFAHLAVMARTAGALQERFDEKLLVEKAKENSPGKFFYICHHARHAADPKTYAAEQAELVEQRKLKLSSWMDGSLLISGVLDPVGGAALRTALEPLAQDRRPRRPRPGATSGGCSGRACLGWRVTSPDSGHELARDSAWAGGCAGSGDGVLAAGFLHDHRAPSLRQQHRPRPARLRVGGDRRRALKARGVRAWTASAQGTRWSLPVAGL